MTLVYYFALLAAAENVYLAFAAFNAFVLSKPTWPFKKAH